ncbi:unnamed protein product [Owenia fusiformis]|uniref:Uncharacterized protein n=1 Tax=Owenia fusiformis TaxID=6347 RepID=A0A8S4Q6G0_OWEFU|nr:unnamed protein product [Owenia fusiformis]
MDHNKENKAADWLDSCFKETLLPQSPWKQVSENICKTLAKKVSNQFKHEKRKEVILQTLGEPFAKQYFPDELPNANILAPPHTSVEERRQLEVEAHSWLYNQVIKIGKGQGCYRIPPGANRDGLSEEMKEFLSHTYLVMHDGMDRELHKLEQAAVKKKRHEIQEEKEHKRKREIARLETWPLRRRQSSLLSAQSSMASVPTSAKIKGVINEHGTSEPVFCSAMSEAIGESVIDILKKDPRRFDEVTARLHGKQLPETLRSYMWDDVLLKEERSRMKDANTETLVRERFGKGVARGVSDLKINRATQSPIAGLIENAVIETYEKTASMEPYQSATHMKEAVRVLNILYTYDRSYEPYLIYWLLLLQIANKNTRDAAEHVYDLAMKLDLLQKNCFPSWPEVFETAEKTLTQLQSVDSEFYNHLKDIAQKNVQSNPKEFMVQLLHQEKLQKTATTDAPSRELLADPIIFLRKWIGEGFVGILDIQAAIIVWDQCIMQKWNPKVLQDFAIALLMLLRVYFIEATDYPKMRKIFLEGPCSLYTMDILKAWVHLQHGCDPTEVPSMNRLTQLRSNQTPSRVSRRTARPGSIASVSLSPNGRVLEPIGVKNISLKLIVPPDSIKKHPWMATVNPKHLQLDAVLHFGSVEIRREDFKVEPDLNNDNTVKYGGREFTITFPPEEGFVYNDINPSNYDLEFEMGGYPYIIFQLLYKSADLRTAIGWSRVPLYRWESDWKMQLGQYSYSVLAGDLPGSSSTQPTDLIGPDCELSVLVYDPKRGTPTPRNNEPTSPRVANQTPANKTRVHKTPVKPAIITPSKQSPAQGKVRTPSPFDGEVHDTFVNHARRVGAEVNPPPSTFEQGFDLYIDDVHFIPDNATIIKVTGRFLRTGEVSGIPDISAYPQLKSLVRSPRFNYRMGVNEDDKQMEAGTLLVLRVYTLDREDGDLVVIGTCLVEVFTKKGDLRVGGHQVALRHGMPSDKGGVAALNGRSMDNSPKIPGCSILFRLLPHSQTPAPQPSYNGGYYNSNKAIPNNSELIVMEGIKKQLEYKVSVQDMARELMAIETEEDPETISDSDLMEWYKQRLDASVQLPSGQAAGNLTIQKMVTYDQSVGACIEIRKGTGFSVSEPITCLAKILEGDGATSSDITWITQGLDPSSTNKDPIWTGPLMTITPEYNQFTVVAVKVKSGNKQIGWTAFPLFDGTAIFGGEIVTQVFSGKKIPSKVIDSLKTMPANEVLTSKINKSGKLGNAKLSVALWDGHFTEEDLPINPLPLIEW